MTITTKSHPRPELEFVDVDLLTLYRRLNDAGEPWSRAVKAGCLEFVAAVQGGGPLAAKPQAAEYRKMLRRLLELEATPPPRRRRRPAAAAVTSARRTRAMPEYINRAGRKPNVASIPRTPAA
jgi:hypothetical protein